jgi:Ras-related protein Rab-8A
VFHSYPRERWRSIFTPADIKTWHSNIEQHASEGVNKILIGNKCDWEEKRVVSLEAGRQLADELGLRFLETSAKANEGVEDAFFTLARCVLAGGVWECFLREPTSSETCATPCHLFHRDIKTRLIDSQPEANNAQAQAALGGRPAPGGVKVGANQGNNNNSSGCC